MKIFISGIAGFLGSHLADSFLRDGHHVVGCDSLIGGELANVPSEAEFYQYDCCFRNSMGVFGNRLTKFWKRLSMSSLLSASQNAGG